MVFPPQRPTNFQGGMGPGNFMFPHHTMNQMNQMPQGGLQGIIQRFLQPNSSVTGTAANSVGGLSNTLNNVQQVLKMVEQTAPVVQQYGPMVKNLPAMFKMMKALKDYESTDEDGSEAESSTLESLSLESSLTESSKDELESMLESSSYSPSQKSSEDTIKKKKRSGNGDSTPKLFI
ncbi:YqfQ-like protein [Oceanobacillus limi]|uniref:YqfQ-like protein n=1 Tax=Oceanobacillus limi TaxID=930131 RepID=A0A1H9ZCP9_9BACI|nr:VrrA/YqfQ family protein [Oceanobacillus limi]SES79112.1 YqfQ-like protein [Oceanobacillus limi]